jgi:hypothetical protein
MWLILPSALNDMTALTLKGMKTILTLPDRNKRHVSRTSSSEDKPMNAP